MPNFDFLCTCFLNSGEGNQRDEAGRVQGRLQQSVCDHGGDKAANWLVDCGFSFISFREDFNETSFELRFDRPVVSPPVFSVLNELLGAFVFNLYFNTELLVD